MKRMDCSTPGNIRNDLGFCVPIESYLGALGNDVYWVSQSDGNDNSPGTRSNPWKTIARANRIGQLSAGDAVIIRGGTYREAVRPTSEGRSGARITFAAYPGENVVINGAEVASGGWTLHEGKIYRRNYSDNWDASCPWRDCSDIAWRRELIAVNGQLLQQVASLNDMEPGTYYVNGSPPNQAPTRMYVWFPGGQSPDNLNIEIGKEPVLFLPSQSPETCSGGSQGYYRLIGMTFRYAVNMVQRAAVCPGTQGSLIEEVTVEKTGSYGIRAAGNRHTFRGNTVQDNGQAGIGGGCDDCLLEFNATLRNNWRHHFFGYEQGGGKFAKANRNTIRYHLSKDNEGAGLWFDGDNENNVVEKSIFQNNLGAGIFMEMSSKYNVIRNNVFSGTRYHRWTGSGILSHATSHNIYQHNTIMGNEGIGLWIRRDPGNRAPEGNNKIFNNLLINNGTSSLTDNSVAKFEIYICTDDNEINGNWYWPQHDEPNHTFFYGPDQWRGDDLSEWKQRTGKDGKAGLLNPGQPAVQNWKNITGWRLVANSQVIGKGALLPTAFPVTIDIDDDIRLNIGADVGADEFESSNNPPPPPPDEPTAFVGETGSLDVIQADGDEWHSVTLEGDYTNPVVVFGGLSQYGPDPAMIRVRNVTRTGFEFQVDEWDNQDGYHATETVDYIVVEAGTHTLSDGTKLQAGTATVDSSPEIINFPDDFSGNPVVFSQIITTVSDRAGVTRHRNVTSDGFEIRINGQESRTSYGNETVAWIALQEGSGSLGDRAYTATSTPNAVTERWYNFSFDGEFDQPPVFISQMQTMDGFNPAVVRYRSLTDNSVELRIAEDYSQDDEMDHTTEVVGVLAIEKGQINASTEASMSKKPAVEISSLITSETPESFNLGSNYPNPFNPQTTIKYSLPEQTHVRIEVFDVAGRRVALLVDEVQSASHHSVTFDARDLPSGLYLYRMQAGSFVDSQTMMLVK